MPPLAVLNQPNLTPRSPSSCDDSTRIHTRRLDLEEQIPHRSSEAAHASKKRKTKKLSVRFNEVESCQEVTRLTNIVSKKRLFFTRSELKAGEARIVSELDYLKRNSIEGDLSYHFLDTESVCLRGIEDLLPRGRQQRLSNIHHARLVVLELQKEQRTIGNLDGKYLARLYRFRTKPSVANALAKAQMDYAAAQEYCKDIW